MNNILLFLIVIVALSYIKPSNSSIGTKKEPQTLRDTLRKLFGIEDRVVFRQSNEPKPPTFAVTPNQVQPPVQPAVPTPILRAGLNWNDLLPWENNRTRRQVLDYLSREMEEIRRMPVSRANNLTRVIRAGGFELYNISLLRRFQQATNRSVPIEWVRKDPIQRVVENTVINKEDMI